MLKNKLWWIKNIRKQNNIKNCGSVFYWWSVENDNCIQPKRMARSRTTDKHKYEYKFSFKRDNTMTQPTLITLQPDEFTHSIRTSPFHSNDKWFLNMANIEIPLDARHILQLGDRFCLPSIKNKQYLMFEFIKHVEHNILKFNFENKSEMRNLCLLIVESFHNQKNQTLCNR